MMENEHMVSAQVFRPRLIVWELASSQQNVPFSRHECLLTIESIARVSKPILVLTGEGILGKTDIYEIVEYGTALGLKIIIEAPPEELTTEILRRYSRFGPKIFRIVVDGCVREDPGTRFKHSPEYQSLLDTARRMRNGGYEVHLSVSIVDNDIRALAFYHDYAVRSGVEGLYFHIVTNNLHDENQQYSEENPDEIIDAIARMKRFSAKEMYVSPQCVKYGVRRVFDEAVYEPDGFHQEQRVEWNHWCLGGKTFAFISPEGKVYMCAAQVRAGGDLRANGYDFEEIWKTSRLFEELRRKECSCEEAQCITGTEFKHTIGSTVDP